MATKYMTVSWDQLHKDARILSERLSNFNFRGIIAITRGGLIPAGIIARELELRLIDTISVVTYDEEKKGELNIIKNPSITEDGNGFLIIDDLVDSGITAKAIRKLLPKAYFACLYAKPAGKEYTDQFIMEVQQDMWILFPWDMAPAFAPPLIKSQKK